MRCISIVAPRSRLASDLQDGEKRLLRDLDMAQLLHALFSFFLTFEKLSLARNIAAVALREHVLAKRLDGRTCDDGAADGGLHGHLEHLPRNQFLHLVHELAAAMIGILAVHDERERVHPLVVDEYIELDQRRRLEMAELIVERGV